MKKLYLLFVLFAFLLHNTKAQQAGDLDPTFGQGGMVTTPFVTGNFNDEHGLRTYEMADGKILVVIGNGSNSVMLGRYNTDGTLDKSFGKDGFSESVYVYGTESIIMQKDGKFLFLGSYSKYTHHSYDYGMYLTRLNSDGTLDKTFGYNGTASYGDYFAPTTMAIEQDGGILVAGYTPYEWDQAYNYNFVVKRFSSNGEEDGSFGSYGMAEADFGSADDIVNSIFIQNDGKLVVLGTTKNGENVDFAIARFNKNGTIDNTFSGDGRLTTNFFPSTNETPVHAIQQTDGKLLVAGYVGNSTGRDIALARYNTNGVLDLTFSGDGKATLDFGTANEAITSVMVQSDGKILLEGYLFNSTVYNLIYSRMHSNGTLDATFDGDGKRMVNLGIDFPYHSTAKLKDGKMLAMGNIYNGKNNDLGLARYDNNGSLDSTFGDKGKVLSFYISGISSYSAIAAQKDGKIISVGQSHDGVTSDIAIARYKADGYLDPTFNGNGKLLIDFGNTNETAIAVALQPDNKSLILVYTKSGSNQDLMLMRYNTNGTLDNSFDLDGKVNNLYAYFSSLTLLSVQSDGKIVMVGNYSKDGKGYLSIVHLNANGSFDNSFDGDGWAITETERGIAAAAIQSDGKVVVVCNDFYLARFHSNGTLDSSFGEDGWAYASNKFDSYYFAENCTIAIKSDGKIVVAGTLWDSDAFFISHYGCGIAQFNNDGTLDISFDGDGALIVGSAEYGSRPVITTDPAGKIYVYTKYSDNYVNYNYIICYNNNGIVDPVFGGFYVNYEAVAMVVQNKRLYVAGKKYDFSQKVSNVAAYLLESNKAPVVKITSPANNSTYTSPANIAITAAASDPDGSISKVEFYNGTKLIATERVAPYAITWKSVLSGTYKLTAKAYDNMGKTTVSAIVQLTVAGTVAPVVNITAPSNSTTFMAPATITISAVASDVDGTISKVEFYNGSTLLATDATAPYSYSWLNVPAGVYQLRVKATDNSGMATMSTAVQVSVLAPNKAPVVKISTPTNLATFTAPATVYLKATASDPDGSIAKVEFYNGTTLLAIEKVAPYAIYWKSVQPGTYKITAKATDNLGKVTTSSIVQISVAANAARLAQGIREDGENENLKATGLQLMPNPAHQRVQVVTKGLSANKQLIISVISIAGSEISTMQTTTSNQRVWVDVSRLVNGLYYIKVQSEDKVLYKQFVKQ